MHFSDLNILKSKQKIAPLPGPRHVCRMVCKGTLPLYLFLVTDDNFYGLIFPLSFFFEGILHRFYLKSICWIQDS
jgi:hypothetical protein